VVKVPTLDDPSVVDTLCDKISEGNGVNAASKIVGINESTVYRRMARDAEFASRIARAREAQQDAECEKTVEMADAATAEDWQVVRMRIWARQWRASKLAPKKYGDKTKVEHSGHVGVDLSKVTDGDLTQLERIVAGATIVSGNTERD